MIADITFTPAQLYSVVGVLVFIGGASLMFRKVFNFATKEELAKVESSIELLASKADLEKMEKGIRFELEKHSVSRHEMRHEVTKLQASMVRVETLLETLPEKLRQGR